MGYRPERCVVTQEKKCRGPAGLRLGRKKPPMGCSRMRLSSKPFAVAAIAPGRYRGCGRNPLACIHTQREPSFSPLGTATNTANPGRVSSDLTIRARHQETLHGERKCRIRGSASGAIRGRVAFSPRCRCIARCARFSRRLVRRDSRTDAGWRHVIKKT